MKNMRPEVAQQFKEISKINIILTVIENLGFLVFWKWDYTVLIGSLWGLLMTELFFYLISVSIPKALRYGDTEMAQKALRLSNIQRLFILGIGIIAAFKISFINATAALIPLLFTGISIKIYHLRRREE